jgi:hypothetical protein
MQGFVSNKTTTAATAQDPLETLLYQIFVAASDHVTVAKLADILNVDVATLRCQKLTIFTVVLLSEPHTDRWNFRCDMLLQSACQQSACCELAHARSPLTRHTTHLTL